ncbi:MAG TPA: tripartite tricarboxylate transporter substrate binding protein [Burkholderiaceae bacterium]|nr:tripartite tricarboxylate transporter substrate binding protein [Burkholderiaceae bacterium]
MDRTRRTLAAAIAALAAGAAPSRAARAQPAGAWPQRPVRIVVPYPPGGPTDIVARVVGARLAERLRQPFVIENRAGAGGNIGAEAVAKAPADGYTLVLGTTAHAINPSLFKSLGYDFQKDFAPVALLTSVPLVLVAHPSLPADGVAQLVALAKSRPPGSIAYGSSGNGQSTHLAAELFNAMAGVSLTHVPYKGSAPALVDLAGGQVQVMFDTMLSAMPQVKAGRVKALAVTSAKRSAAAPELPTIAESGLPGYEATAWNGLLAPAGTPPDVVATLSRAVNEVLAEPETRQRFAADGADAVGGTPGQFASFIRTETDKWREVVKTASVKID